MCEVLLSQNFDIVKMLSLCNLNCYNSNQPSVIIHSAAERRPDVVENNPKGTQQLNIQATEYICQAASKKSEIFDLFTHF